MTERYDKSPRRDDAITYADPFMPDPHRILLAGDTHGDANAVRTLIQRAEMEKAEVLFVLGDFGIWDHHDGGAFTDHVSRFSAKAGIPVCFLPGNHDNYDLLFEWEATKPRYADGFYEIKDGVFYSPRGHRFTWSGVRFVSLGGAYSVDKTWRVIQDQVDLEQVRSMKSRGLSLSVKEQYLLDHGQKRWWSQEEISEQEMRDAMKGGPVDVMLAHDKPRDAKPGWNRKDLEECWPNQQKIQSVVDATRPWLYIHGHLHYAYQDVLTKTETYVHGLDCDPAASRSSGGSGKTINSWAVLDLDVSPSREERGMRLRRTVSGEEVNTFLPFDEDVHEFPKQGPIGEPYEPKAIR
jgi:Icc-related predicted phosphoesterase